MSSTAKKEYSEVTVLFNISNRVMFVVENFCEKDSKITDLEFHILPRQKLLKVYITRSGKQEGWQWTLKDLANRNFEKEIREFLENHYKK